MASARIMLLPCLCVLLPAATGCTRLGFDHQSAPVRSEAGVDAARDIAPAGDVSAVEGSSDLPAAELPQATDLSLDLAADLSVPDLDLAGACGLGSFVAVLGAKMVLCQRSQPINQCAAAAACGTGWHLCRSSEYQARGGATAGPSANAWLAGCIRTADSVYAPTTTICSSCQLATGAMLAISWGCSSGTTSMDETNLGVVATPVCNRIGLNSPTTAAFWKGFPARVKLSQLVCCR